MGGHPSFIPSATSALTRLGQFRRIERRFLPSEALPVSCIQFATGPCAMGPALDGHILRILASRALSRIHGAWCAASPFSRVTRSYSCPLRQCGWEDTVLLRPRYVHFRTLPYGHNSPIACLGDLPRRRNCRWFPPLPP